MVLRGAGVEVDIVEWCLEHHFQRLEVIQNQQSRFLARAADRSSEMIHKTRTELCRVQTDHLEPIQRRQQLEQQPAFTNPGRTGDHDQTGRFLQPSLELAEFVSTTNTRT